MAYPTVVSSSYPTTGQRIPNPAHPISEGIKSSSLSWEADSGHSQRRRKAPPKRTFQLTYVVLTEDQYKTLRGHFLSVLNVDSFTWIHPVEKVTYTVKYAQDTFAGENFGYGPKGPLYKLQISLEQVL